jgi:type I restriction enzyme, R subunit
LEKVVDDDPMFDKKKARKKLRKYVESHDHAVGLKAEIIVDHFNEFVIAPRKIGGEARAMVICSSIPRAVQYYLAIKNYLQSIKSPYAAGQQLTRIIEKQLRWTSSQHYPTISQYR